MGAEQSLEKKKKIEEENQRAIQQILDQQRRIYEKKGQEMLRQQATVSTAKEVNEGYRPHNINLNNYAPLYPNLSTSEVGVQPSTSRASHNVNTTTQNQIPNNTAYKYSCQASASAPHMSSAPTAPTSASKTLSFQPTAPNAVSAAPALRSKFTGNNDRKNNNRNDGRSCSCSTCKNNLGVKIYQCGLGHSSCMVCKFKGVKCGVCTNPITDTRNIDLEHYMAELELNTSDNTEKASPCPNQSDGCRLYFKRSNIDAHLKECPFREMACPVAFLNAACMWRGKINHIKAHFLDCHPNQTGADVDTEMNLNFFSNNDVVHHVVLGNFHFLVYLKLDGQNLYSAAQLIGSRTSAKKWTYELHIYNKSEPRRKYMYIDGCDTNSNPFNEMRNESNCAVLPIAYVRSFVTDNKVTYKYYIKKEGKENDGQRGKTNQRGRGRQSRTATYLPNNN